MNPKRRWQFVATTNSDYDGPILLNLARNIMVDKPNQLWGADVILASASCISP